MPSLTDFLDRAITRRDHLDLGATDALRLVDADGDHLPGLVLDTFADRRLLATTSATLDPAVRAWITRAHHTTYWKILDQHERESPAHLAGPPADDPFTVIENGVRFRINFQAGYSQGLFLDQRDNRRRLRERCRPGDAVLNTFAYTGAFSVCAALAGAVATTLDLSQPYLDWARENFRLNGLDPAAHHFCKGDTFHWLRRFGRQGRRFQGIVLDPPTFSRDDKGTVFRAEQDFGALVALAAACLAPRGWILATTNCRRLPLPAFERMVHDALPVNTRLQSFAMPPDFTGDPYLKSLLALT